ncbi:MAG: hypothetical protein HOW73_27905 [Polyangiaceae bacterium]|nr:hypothetical protein [Polyangiaceae bacterium]
MTLRARSILVFTLAGSLVVSATLAACGDSGSTSNDGGSGAGGSNTGASPSTGGNGGEGNSGAGFVESGGGGSGSGGQTNELDVQPNDPQTLDVTIGQQTPTLAYTATYNGSPVNAGWSVDRGNLGSVAAGPASTTTLTPTGTTGGALKVVAGLNGTTVERDVFIKLSGQQNGYDPNNPLLASQIPQSVTSLTEGGGVGGVGGEGLGGAVNDPNILTALSNPSSNGQAENLKLIYPYDGTVWPRGLLAPNLMWRWSLGDADAIRIELSTTTQSFSWVGTFARPDILAQTGGAFIRHPIPQDIWKMATDTAGGTDRLRVRLTVAKDGQAYGPIEHEWTIAPARLSGTIYYNSYGTQLAKNLGGAIGGDGQFGGAVLSIRAGDPGPALTAGGNGNSSQCRVCHSVAANGSRLVAQWGNDSSESSVYDLSPNGVTFEGQLTNDAEFPALSTDGSMMLAPNGTLYPLPDSTNPLPATGLTSVSTSLGTPAFSPDMKRVVFGMLLSGSMSNPTQKLVVMDFDQAALAFSNPVAVVDYTGQPAQTRPGWAAFFPDGNSVIFHTQLAAGVDGNGLADLRTRKGARAEISWVSATNPNGVTRLDRLNGYDQNGAVYLPQLETPVALGCTGDGAQVGNIDTSHQDDVHLNYEPTVNPVASGGYAWVVFTSRRLYGSVATIPPFCSDPRGVNLVQNITPKKLWVAAVDITGQPGTDASHPAFYLPGQELLAGNSRGFWALDPCKMDGEGCEAGDECCNGYCQPDDSGELVCSNEPPNGECSQPQEVCTTAADCCDMDNLCINGFCTETPPG